MCVRWRLGVRGNQEVTKDDMEIVSALQAALADKVGKDRYEMWFGANARIAIASDALTVSVPNTFYEDWLRKNFRRQIEEACCETLGRELSVAFHVDPCLARDAATGSAAPASGSAAPASGSAAPASGSAATNSDPPASATSSVSQVGKAEIDALPRRPDAPATGRRFATLEAFVTGPGNRLAIASAAEIVAQPGRVSPLVIYGPTGVGKTHLLEGIWTAAKRQHARLQAIYLSAEQFTSHFLDALRTSGVPNFRGKYRGVELLLIDDLQFFAGKKATIGELVHTVDALARAGRQVVFTADRPPSALAGLGPELTARLAAGLACRIDPADFATRVGILRGQSARLGMELAEDVLEWVASHFCRHARELAGALLKLHATSRALERPITVALAAEALMESMSQSKRAVKLCDVQQAVCEVLGVEPDSLRSGRRTSAAAHPRMLAMWLARKHTRAALAEIGEFFGKRSHTTVISANKKVGQWLAEPQTLRLADHTLTLAEAVRKVEERLLVG